MKASDITVALASLISLGAIWVTLFWLYRDYCVDRFRQDMFALRDDLFDAAHAGKLSFDHPAYGVLRNTMNGFIRFAHRFSLLHALLLLAVAHEADARALDSFPARWNRAVSGVSPDDLHLLSAYRYRMNALVLKYVLLSSPILLATIVFPLVAWLAARFCLAQLVGFLRRPLDGLDSAALAEGQV
jgi:hypothetical protein